MPATGVEEIAPALFFDPTGDSNVDALLFGRAYEADSGSNTVTVSFSFPTANSLYSDDVDLGYGPSDSEPYYSLTGVSEDTKDIFRDAVAQIERFTNLDFVEVADEGNNAGTVRIAWTSEPDDESVAWAYLPSNTYVAGDIWLQADNASEDDIDFQQTITHEFGHALGLKHPFEAQGDFPAIDSQFDGVDYTVMSYDVSARFPDAQWADLWPQTYMYFDILALQAMYGVDTVTTAGTNTYDYDLGARHYLTIWDYGGADSFGVSGGTTDVHINLTPGTWSNVGTTIEYQSNSGSTFDNETVYIADDTIIENGYGASGDDTVQGNSADNGLTGNAGNDLLFGDAGDDVLRGNAGDDVSHGGTGNDAIWAGSGDAGDDVAMGNAGNDTLGGAAGSDFLIGGGFDDGSTSNFSLATNDASADGSDILFGGSGDDTLLGGGWDDGAVTDNGVFDAGEEVTTGTGTDAIWAGSGDDLVYGAAGNDALGGGTDDDTIFAGGGNDTVYGGKGTGADNIDGGAGNDVIFSGQGNDTLSGGAGNDDLFSGAGTDQVDGGAGNDTLWGGGGNDQFTGGSGADTFVFEVGHGDDTVTDFSTGSDILQLSDTTTDFTSVADVQAAATAQGNDVLIDLGGGDSVLLEDVSIADLANVEYVF